MIEIKKASIWIRFLLLFKQERCNFEHICKGSRDITTTVKKLCGKYYVLDITETTSFSLPGIEIEVKNEKDEILEFRKDQRVKWTHRHSLNSKSVTTITKYGTFVKERRIQKQDGGMSWPEKYGVVLFDGNKNPSTILFDQLEKAEE